MNCACTTNVFETSLHYASPAHGGWGVLKVAQLIPESYYLFVSPAACGRHGALGARMEGRKDRVSYLFLTEDSIVSGDYEQMLMEGIDQLFSFLKKRNRMPKVMGIFVSCIDDLLGTDHEAILAELSEKYPDIRFLFCHMNPTSTDTGIPPIVNIQNKIYSVLEARKEKDMGVNLIGSHVPLQEKSELFEVLQKMGVSKIRHISQFDTFDSYQSMAGSCLNLSLAPSAEYACKKMKQKLGISSKTVYFAFRLENIRRNYAQIAEALQRPLPNLEYYEMMAKAALEEARYYLRHTPLILDAEAITRVFELARCLLEQGFSVKRIYAQQVLPSDKENYEWVMKHHPEIEIRQSLNPKVTAEEPVEENCLAIGYSAGYLSGAKHVVDIGGQNGLYGYFGLIELLQKMCEARDAEADLKKIIEDAVLIV